MGVEWNPSFPDQIGVQRNNAGYGSKPVTTQSEWESLEFTALHSGELTYLELFGTGKTESAGPTQHDMLKPIAVDLYDGELPQYDIFLTQYSPTAITGSSSIFNENGAAATVDRITSINDGLYLKVGAINHWVKVQFPTDSFPDGRRILGVRWFLRLRGTTEVRRWDYGPSLPGAWTKTRTFGGTSNWFLLMTEPHANVLGAPTWYWWRPDMVREFRAGGGLSNLFVRAKSVSGWFLDTVRMQVLWTPETRVGVGLSPPAGKLEWTKIPIRTIIGTGAPSIVAGNKYTAVVRQPWQDSEFALGTATLSWRDLNGTNPVTGWASRKIPVSVVNVTGGTLSPIPRAWKPDLPVFPVYKDSLPVAMAVSGAPHDEGGVVMATSMPYNLSRGVPVRNAQFLSALDERILEQSIQVTGAATSMVYGRTGAIIGWDPNKKPQDDATITMEVVTTTGAPESTVLSPTSRTFKEIRQIPVEANFPIGEGSKEFRRVTFRHPENATLPAGTYRIRISADGLVGGREFYVETLIGDLHTFNQTYGGDNENAYGTWTSSTGDHPLTGSDSFGTWYSDLQAVLMTVPPAVSGLTASQGFTSAHHAGTCVGEGCDTTTGCADTASPYMQLEWLETSDAESTKYEIQRSDPVDTTFRTVAMVDGKATTIWLDHEARIGVQSNYRIRSLRDDGTTGDWSLIAVETLSAVQVALSFTSNAATGMATVYPEIWDKQTATREWLFQEYDDVVIRAIHARERQVAFHPVERRGVQFTRMILLNALCTVNPPTMTTFSPLRLLSWAPLPYVCVRDGEGNRWYANIRVPTGVNERPGEMWFAEINVTEVSAIPYIVDTAVPQLTEDNIGTVPL